MYPYGSETADRGTTIGLGYTGASTDPTTGLVYLLARDYEPTTGQFLTIDPGIDQSQQSYA